MPTANQSDSVVHLPAFPSAVTRRALLRSCELILSLIGELQQDGVPDVVDQRTIAGLRQLVAANRPPCGGQIVRLTTDPGLRRSL